MEENDGHTELVAAIFIAIVILILLALLIGNSNHPAYNVTNSASTAIIRNHWEPRHNYYTGYSESFSSASDSCIILESRKGLEKLPPFKPQINNLNSLLHDIYLRYVGLRADDFELHYKMFDKIFQTLHQTMKEVDPYYKKYSSTVQFAGSHFDRLRIKKPDEFDMDIIIGLPLNIRHDPTKESDIIIEPKSAGFLQLKMGVQFLRLPMRDRHEWEINKTAYEWKDSSNYLLRSKFLDWFKSVVIRALNRFEQDFQSRPTFVVDGITYTIRTSESGPAVTLIIENRLRGFHLDVDLVPALKFPEDRWPIGNGYRDIPPECRKGVWMVVGKPDLASCDAVELSRTWRLALHNQERELMHDTYNLRPAMRLLKKLRDEQGMDEIASYYIKTLFYLEIVERGDKQYWSENNPATILILMVKKFKKAIDRGVIPYFWNEDNNLIANVPENIRYSYSVKLDEFIDKLETISILEKYKDWDGKEYYKAIAKYLLTTHEYEEYKELIDRVYTPRCEDPITFQSRGIYEIPEAPLITNLNSLLHDIYIRYIALKTDDFRLHYYIFDKVFQKLHQTMKDVDPYYKKYSSTVQFAGSHFDRLRIKKPDEFDMDIVIGLPLNIRHDPTKESDIIIEPKSAGFLQLKMGVQFLRLPMRDRYEWEINKTAYEWKDSSNYLLRSKFLDWFKSVVIRALNRFEQDFQSRPTFVVDGITYTIRTSESGPAVTLIIENRLRGFHLDVDLVPALKFPEDRWPIGNCYRDLPPECRKGVWMVVGKPNRAAIDKVDSLRSWRIALHNQERVLMHDSYNLRQAMKFLKKLRDAQGMHEIASYYIKTIFYWEIVERNDKQYWSENNPATILKMMALKFHDAIVRGNHHTIPYFWNKRNNLIANVPKSKLDMYAKKLAEFIDVLHQPILYKEVAKHLLNTPEYKEYKIFL